MACYQTPPQLVMSGGQTPTTVDNFCDGERTNVTDSVPRHAICTCHCDVYNQRVSAPINLYSTTIYPSEHYSMAPEHVLYPGIGLKENLETWRNLPYPIYSPYDPVGFAGYPFLTGYSVDLNVARRKNATRETTNTLKAWLYEHRKNPYPTKGEKIMLAIITKMTLTQVSTWFANARRRLKKENKMTWEPRSRCEDEDVKTHQDKDCLSEEEEEEFDDDKNDEEKLQKTELLVKSEGSEQIGVNLSERGHTSNQKSESHKVLLPSKPRIWSIVDTATSDRENAVGLTVNSSSEPSAGDSLAMVSSLNRLRTTATTYDPTSAQNLTVPRQDTSPVKFS